MPARETLAVVPAKDEAENLPATLAALKAVPGVCSVLVVDDGSTDGTGCLAASLGADVLINRRGSGKGGALLCGLLRAKELGAEAVLLADADLSHSARELSSLLETLSPNAPFVVAAFPKSAAGGGGLGLVKNYARRAVRRKTGFSSTEPLSGQRALLLQAVELLPGVAPGFGAEVGMTLDLLAAGVPPVEVLVDLAHRPTGRSFSGFAHRARQGLDITRALRGERLKW